VAGGVAQERLKTAGRVEVAGGVAKERFKAIGCIEVAGIAKERSFSRSVNPVTAVLKEAKNPPGEASSTRSRICLQVLQKIPSLCQGKTPNKNRTAMKRDD
jgi:hypothetical protein